MTDQEKELIELAAEAMGWTILAWTNDLTTTSLLCSTPNGDGYYFNPLTSRDDRAMLQDELVIDTENGEDDNGRTFIRALTYFPTYVQAVEYHNNTTDDRKRAANLAVTRVAAERGRSR